MNNDRQRAAEQCPPANIWCDLACGQVAPSEQLVLLTHAAGCDACGALLLEASSLFNPQVTEEEQAFLDTVVLPARPPAFDASPKKKPVSQYVWYAAAAAGIIVAFTAGWQWNESRNSPQVLLAQAYTEHRTMELRFAGAKYSPVRAERGGGSTTDRPLGLLQAEPRIRRGLELSPQDVHLLHARAQVELLEWKFDAALADLNLVVKTNPNDVLIHIDLASAYFQKAEAEKSTQFYKSAMEAITTATMLEPNNAAAWFNRGIIESRLSLSRESSQSFDRSAALETSQDWAAEARRYQELLKTRF